jgi:hypothetical protein
MYQTPYIELSTKGTKLLYQEGSFLVQKLVLLIFYTDPPIRPWTEKYNKSFNSSTPPFMHHILLYIHTHLCMYLLIF